MQGSYSAGASGRQEEPAGIPGPFRGYLPRYGCEMAVPTMTDAGRARRAWERRRAARRRRNVLFGGILLVVVVIVIATTVGSSGGRGPAGGKDGPDAGGTGGGGNVPARDAGPPAVESGTLPWQLAAPISREVLMPSSTGGTLLIAGGLSGGGSSDSGVYTIGVHDGALKQVGSLSAPTHDAAGGWVGSSAVVAGGGDSTVGDATDLVPQAGGAVTAAGHLPQPRADCAGVSIGGVFYLVGGYDGKAMDAEVLSTTDGRSWHDVAALPHPVRYPAVAALGGRIYVFGGLSASGAPVDTVQVVDPARHTAVTGASLPLPLAGAVAVEVGGHVLVAGGDTGSGSAAHPVAGIYELDPASGHLLAAGRLAMPVAYAGAAETGGVGYVVGGESAGGTPTAAVQMLRPDPAFGVAGQPGAGSPYYGYQLLVADRGNERLLVIDDTGKIVWTYPAPGRPAPPGGFYYPDDAFFADHGREILVTQEDNHTITLLAYPSGKVLWTYGHAHRSGYAAGYVDNPDDAYLLRNGMISTADIINCRVILISPSAHRVVRQIGSGPNACGHQPPSELGSPNGDTPLGDGNILVSEINGSWIDEFTPQGRLVWSTQLPIVAYPSDPQQVAPDRYLVADYSLPGAFVEFDRAGHVLYRYAPQSGPGELNKPSLAESLPSGVLMANDDYNDRMVAVDPATGALVWQYGVQGHPGTAPGLLNTPDGFDLLGPGGVTPTHSPSG
jgi:outer membrane protein assembly factor BamB